MNITPEQYYWYIRRNQILNAHAIFGFGCGGNSEEIEFTKSLKQETEYLWSAKITNYDWKNAEERMQPPKAACSSMRKGKYHFRNLDYYYDFTPEFLLKIPQTEDHYASIALVQFPAITEDDVKNKNEKYYKAIKYIPFPVMDGINQYGIVTNQNLMPIGDNPDHPLLFNEYKNGEMILHKYWNRTYHTNKNVSTRRCLSFLQRTVLDSCRNIEDVVTCITKNFDWFAYFKGDDDKTEGLELHYMISDPNTTIIVEFINTEEDIDLRKDSVSDIIIHYYTLNTIQGAEEGQYIKTKIERYRNSILIETIEITEEEQENNPIYSLMTNFYITGWDGKINDFNNVPLSNDTLTRYAMGLERYDKLHTTYGWNINEPIRKGLVEMRHVNYYEAYKISGDNHPKMWYSEFNDPLNTTISDLSGNYKGIHFGLEENLISSNAYDNCIKGLSSFEYGVRRPAEDKNCVWITVNRSVYNVENKTLSVVVQQEGERGLGWDDTDLSIRCFSITEI